LMKVILVRYNNIHSVIGADLVSSIPPECLFLKEEKIG
jgi:hypothetical protein